MITYRYKLNGIASLDDFSNMRAEVGSNEVFFGRILGAPSGIATKVTAMDQKMALAMQENRLDYSRLAGLSKLVSPDDIAFYSTQYDCYKNKQTLKFRKVTVDANLSMAICSALDKVSSDYKRAKSSVTDSILKNFVVKVLFWMDDIGADILVNWNENRCIKVVAENITKEQEYLFFYVLTQIGCDVVLLQTEKDVETMDALKNLSVVVSTDAYSKVSIPAYQKSSGQISNSQMSNNQISNSQMSNNQRSTSAVRSGGISLERPTVPISLVRPASYKGGTPAKERRELNYEELARLASSIVMIAVQNNEGEVECTGSGIMVSSKGYILTNCHVASAGSSYMVRIEDDDTIYRTDELVKYNQNADLALIRIDKQLNPLPIYRGPQKLVRGQKVVAIGSPLGLFNSVSDGIISGFRNIRDEDMIQFTAPISSGSSGGAVLNMYGEVIGISTAGIDGGQNINLAMGYESIWDFAGGFLQG